MAETGIVIKQKENYVTVKLERREACAKCRACTAGFETKDMIIEAENICHAQEGDQVEISLEQSNFLKAVLIMYTIPLISLLSGLGVGYLISYELGLKSTELIAVICGFALLAVSYIIIKNNEDKWRDKKFRPVAINIVREKEKGL